MKKLCLTIAFLFSLSIPLAVELAAQDLTIWEVWGNDKPGTATLIEGSDGTIVLYDSEQNYDFALQFKGILDNEGISYIDYVIIGHYDLDHCKAPDEWFGVTFFAQSISCPAAKRKKLNQ